MKYRIVKVTTTLESLEEKRSSVVYKVERKGWFKWVRSSKDNATLLEAKEQVSYLKNIDSTKVTKDEYVIPGSEA
jgi:hypothetical protein